MITKNFIKYLSIITINVIIGTLLVRWLLLHVDFNLIIHETRQLNQASIFYALLLGLILYIFYGLRMALLLDIKLLPSTQIIIMGYGLNALLPFRLGDALKIFFTKQFFQVNLSKTTFATVVEKGMDLTVIGCLALIFILHSTKDDIAAILSVAIVLLIFFKFDSTVLLKINNKLLKKIIYLSQMMFTRKKSMLIFICTTIIWCLTCLAFYVFFNMNMTADAHFAISDAFVLLILTTLSLSIPSLPAGLGLFESGIVYYLTQHFHFAAEKAVAYAIVFHLIIVLPQVIFTFIIMFVNSLNSKKINLAVDEA